MENRLNSKSFYNNNNLIKAIPKPTLKGITDDEFLELMGIFFKDKDIKDNFGYWKDKVDKVFNKKEWHYDTLDCYSTYIILVRADSARKVLKEVLEEKDFESLGLFNTDLIEQSFKRTKELENIVSIITVLKDTDNREELGKLMANACGFFDNFLDVVIENYGEMEVVNDFIMHAEGLHEITIGGVDYYVGGY